MNQNRREFLVDQVKAFIAGEEKMNPIDKLARLRDFLRKHKADLANSELFLRHPELDIRVGPFLLGKETTHDEAIQIVLREGRAFYQKYDVFPRFEIEYDIIDSGS